LRLQEVRLDQLASPYAKHVDLWDLIPVAWHSGLEPVRLQIACIGQQLDDYERAGVTINPPREQIFASLALAPQDVRVVIIGQDPYPNSAHAMGLSFSVPEGTRPLPPSLRNILAELASDVGESAVSQGSLEPWQEQGVLLLNRVLTVESGRSDSHKSLGWQPVTEAILTAVLAANPDVIAVLWGSQAQQVSGMFKPDCVIQSVHPSPLSAYRGFLGSRPFSAVNRLLAKHQVPEIHW
jgi:uracil-DNA glycosylase